MARDSKIGDESAGYGGSTCSGGGKTTSSPDKEEAGLLGRKGAQNKPQNSQNSSRAHLINVKTKPSNGT